MYDDIPQEIYEAARKIDLFFKMRGIEKWEFLNVQSRRFERSGSYGDEKGTYAEPVNMNVFVGNQVNFL